MLIDGKYEEVNSRDPVRSGHMSLRTLKWMTYSYIALTAIIWIRILVSLGLHGKAGLRLVDFGFAVCWTALSVVWLFRLRQSQQTESDSG